MFIFASTAVMLEGFTRIFVIDTWIALGFWVGIRVVMTLLLPDNDYYLAAEPFVFIFALTDVMLTDVTSGQCETVIVLLLFAYKAVMTCMFSIAGRGYTSDEGSTRMFVIDTWIALGC